MTGGQWKLIAKDLEEAGLTREGVRWALKIHDAVLPIVEQMESGGASADAIETVITRIGRVLAYRKPPAIATKGGRRRNG